ncbi:MAG: SOS response-associated peptidase [Actinomycetales bacterium]|nr:SOS response-associated peptidase [Actinomycetales bacterium]
MCGRYAATRTPEELAAVFSIPTDAPIQLSPDYNVAPTKRTYAVLERARGEGSGGPDGPDHAGEEGAVRQLAVVRWGLLPAWAKDPAIASRLINARQETAASKPSFRSAYRRRRCLVPVDGYYEWYRPPGRPAQPFYFTPAAAGILPLAGLYEVWRDRSLPDDDPEALRVTMALLTTTATPDVAGIHDRMPMTVPPEHWAAWLDPALTDPEGATQLLHPAGAVGLAIHPVSTRVNAVRNNGPELITPIPAVDLPQSDH